MGGEVVRPLSRELLAQYDISVKKLQYIRSNYYLDTNHGKFMLRKVDLPREQILFNYEVDTHLRDNGFKEINAIYTTKKKSPFALVGDQCYIMQEYVNCDETDFKNFQDLKETILVLARFHKACRGVESTVRDIDVVKIKNIYEHYCKRMGENAKLKKNMMSLKQKSNFEIMFLESVDEYRQLEEMALETINYGLVEAIIAEIKKKKLIAHRDYTYHTVNKTQMNTYIIGQIDMCGYDIQVLDLAHILSKIMQKNDWDSCILYNLIEAYNSVRILSAHEFNLLKFMMIYPERYNSICYKYISSKRRWNYSMFEQKWENMLVYKDRQLATAKLINKW